MTFLILIFIVFLAVACGNPPANFVGALLFSSALLISACVWWLKREQAAPVRDKP